MVERSRGRPTAPVNSVLDSYFARIEYSGDRTLSLATLEALHQAHAAHIPFENLDILLGRPIRLDIPHLQRKLIDERRGGYCFEHNTLFAAVLEELGFPVTRLAARVRYQTTAIRPRTHMMLLVTVPEGRWIADVGFGAEGLMRPIPFGNGAESAQSLWTYRAIEEAGHWVVQSRRQGEWADLYAFTLEPAYPIDYEMGNYFTSTHPASPFAQQPIVQRTTPEGRAILRGRELLLDRGDTVTSRQIGSDEELLEVLRDTFGLDFPAGTRFTAAPA